MSPLDRYSKDPNCIMAVDAIQGGRWLSPLRDGVAMPSTELRNFATVPGTWDLLKLRFSDPDYFSLGDSFSFDIAFSYNPEPAIAMNLMQASATKSPLVVIGYAGGRVYWYTNLFLLKGVYDFAAQQISATPLTAGAHTLHLELLSQERKMGFSLDGTAISYQVLNTTQYDAATVLVNTATTTTNFDGTISSLVVTNLTKNKVIFEYTINSWVEKTLLVLANNTQAENGYFEAIDKSSNWKITTALDVIPQTLLVFDKQGTLLQKTPAKAIGFTGSETCRAILAYDTVLPASQIAAISKTI